MIDKRYVSTGFTMIDLVIVLAVMALLAALALPALVRLRSTSISVSTSLPVESVCRISSTGMSERSSSIWIEVSDW